jgi:hypothetical protein
MSIEAAKALKAKLQADEALMAFFFAHYGKDAKHLIGYKRSSSAADYPFIAYVVPQSDIGDPSGERVIVSVVIGVNDAGVTDGVFDGVAHADAVARLVIGAIDVGTIDSKTVWLGQARVVTDLGARHPYYETEIILPLLYRG